MLDISSLLPILIPVGLLQLGLTVAALVHVFTHNTYKTGSRALWAVVSLISISGPVLYFILGRSDE